MVIFPVLLLLAVVLVSCSHHPKTFAGGESILKGRQDYVSAHPDGVYNDHILNGEVVKGMNLMEVLASWGLPNSRRHSESGSLEYWFFISQDKEMGMVRRYELVFQDQLLHDWDVVMSSTAGGYQSKESSDHITLGDGEQSTKSTVLKKK
jgi:hypothetical protein